MKGRFTRQLQPRALGNAEPDIDNPAADRHRKFGDRIRQSRHRRIIARHMPAKPDGAVEHGRKSGRHSRPFDGILDVLRVYCHAWQAQQEDSAHCFISGTGVEPRANPDDLRIQRFVLAG